MLAKSKEKKRKEEKHDGRSKGKQGKQIKKKGKKRKEKKAEKKTETGGETKNAKRWEGGLRLPLNSGRRNLLPNACRFSEHFIQQHMQLCCFLEVVSFWKKNYVAQSESTTLRGAMQT